MNPKKIINICLIIIAVFLYLTASQIAEVFFDLAKVPVTRDFWLTFPEIIAVLVTVAAYFAVVTNKAAMVFLVESVGELAKVTAPTFKESSQSAVVVIVMVVFATVTLGLFDKLWSFLTKLVLTS